GRGCRILDLRPLLECRSLPPCGLKPLSCLVRFGGSVAREDRLQTVLRGSEEVVTREELRALLDRTGTPRAYVGREPAGLLHIGTAFVIGSKVADLVAAGFHTTSYLADSHANPKEKLSGNLKTPQDG